MIRKRARGNKFTILVTFYTKLERCLEKERFVSVGGYKLILIFSFYISWTEANFRSSDVFPHDVDIRLDL